MGRCDEGGAPPARSPRGIFAGCGDVGRALTGVDWGATPLGPPGGWSPALTSAVGIVLRSRFSMWMAWGPELTFFCNDAYRRDTLGAKYPWALGRPASEVWREIWPDIAPRVEKVLATGEATWDEALQLILERSGYPEETYHTFSYSPLSDGAGGVPGLLCVVTEDTAQVIATRRMATLRDLGSDPTAIRTEEDVLRTSARHLGGNPQDLPFCCFYTFDDEGVAYLRATSGIAAGDQAAPVRLGAEGEPAWPSTDLARGATVLVEHLERRFAGLPSGPWDGPPHQALVLPLPQQGQARPAGFLVAALNRHRRLDDAYRAFLELVTGQVAAGLATARAYAAERHRAEQLAELDRAKTAFFANVSHEFRTPLTLLLGPVEDALADARAPLAPGQRLRVEAVQRNALRLLKLVNTLLDFSRLEAGQVDARFRRVDLAADTRELASAFAGAIERAGLTFDVDCPPLPDPVWVDRDMWAKVVLNLLSNALKFTFDGGITVRLRAAGEVAELSVADTGTGIAPGEQERLFERFYRAAATRARTHEGSGIGLALVADLVALHGGSVRVTSDVGAGSEFTVELPLGTAHLPPAQVGPGELGTGEVGTGEVGTGQVGTGEGAEAGAVDPGSPADAGRWAEGFIAEAERWLRDDEGLLSEVDPAGGRDERPKVVVIDDNADMRQYVARLLAERYEVATAADGPAGVALARRWGPDLVLSDVMLPGLDGFGVLAALRADEATEGIPVVLLSARAGEEATVEGLEAGADDYLVKPFTARELLARVGANLELDRARRVRARLERSQDLLDQAQRLARVGSWEFDLASGSLTASDEMLRQLEMTGSEVTGDLTRTLLERTHPDDTRRVRATVERALSTCEPFDVEFRTGGANGAVRFFRTLGEVRVDNDGQVVGLRGSSQDVTEQREFEEKAAVAAAHREAAAREHRIADELQRSLVPAPSFTPDNLSIATYYRPGVEGTQVGGDWYDVIELGAGRTALVLGDVMGRGVRAAAVMGQLRAAIRAYAQLDLPPGDVLELLDRAVRDLGEDQIVTCVYAVYDPSDRTLTYANAGHLPPLLCEPGAPPRRLGGGGVPPLGVGSLNVVARRIPLTEGTLLALYTDGLIERRGSDIDRGVDRLAGLISGFDGPMSDLPDRLVEALLPHGPDDDVAVLLVLAHDHGRPTRSASLPIEAGGQAVGSARRFVGVTLTGWAVAPAVAENAVLVASELVTNAVRYGDPPLELRLHCTETHLVVQVLDGAAYLPRRRQVTANDEHGRGLQIVAALGERWGSRPTAEGKAVWCVLPVGAA